MMLSKVTSIPVSSFLLLVTFTILVLPSLVQSYATSNNSEDASSLLSSPPSGGKEHRKTTRDVTDTNQSSSSSSSQSSLPPLVTPSSGTSNNASQVGTLLVTKQVVNEGGGEAEPSDFTITVDGNNPTPSSFDGSSSGTTIQLFRGKLQGY